MTPLKLEDIKVWPKKLYTYQFTDDRPDKDNIILSFLNIDNEYGHFSKNHVLQWINTSEGDRKLFYKSIFDEEMLDIINER